MSFARRKAELKGTEMLWSQPTTEKMADLLRFIIRAALLSSAIAAALAFSYLAIKLVFFFARWLDKIWFSRGPW
jgi:hypothetical protein